MNCMQALAEELRKCEPCRVNAFIIEFEDLPEEEKHRLQDFEVSTNLVLYCKMCHIYKLLPEKGAPIRESTQP